MPGQFWWLLNILGNTLVLCSGHQEVLGGSLVLQVSLVRFARRLTAAFRTNFVLLHHGKTCLGLWSSEARPSSRWQYLSQPCGPLLGLERVPVARVPTAALNLGLSPLRRCLLRTPVALASRDSQP